MVMVVDCKSSRRDIICMYLTCFVCASSLIFNKKKYNMLHSAYNVKIPQITVSYDRNLTTSVWD